MKGWIALDIDGTITVDKFLIPPPVVSYLESLQEMGWKIVLVTGRPLAYTEEALKPFGFPFFLICQNGSVAFQMPKSSFLFKNYLAPDLIQEVEKAFHGLTGDLLVYAGFERGDVCFYRPEFFNKKDCEYIKDLKTRQKEKWVEVKNFDASTVGFVPLIKCFGPKEKMSIISNRLLSHDVFEIAQIKDPQYEGTEILLITAKGVTKGSSLERLLEEKGKDGIVIAAGDDLNDVSLFQVADRKIAMPHAPKILLEMANPIAPPTEKMGIIQALQEEISNES